MRRSGKGRFPPDGATADRVASIRGEFSLAPTWRWLALEARMPLFPFSKFQSDLPRRSRHDTRPVTEVLGSFPTRSEYGESSAQGVGGGVLADG